MLQLKNPASFVAGVKSSLEWAGDSNIHWTYLCSGPRLAGMSFSLIFLWWKMMASNSETEPRYFLSEVRKHLDSGHPALLKNISTARIKFWGPGFTWIFLHQTPSHTWENHRLRTKWGDTLWQHPHGEQFVTGSHLSIQYLHNIRGTELTRFQLTVSQQTKNWNKIFFVQ